MSKYKHMYRIYFENKEDFKDWLDFLVEEKKAKIFRGIDYWLNHYSRNNYYMFTCGDVGWGELNYAKSEGIEVVDFTKKEYISWGNQVIRIYNMLND